MIFPEEFLGYILYFCMDKAVRYIEDEFNV